MTRHYTFNITDAARLLDVMSNEVRLKVLKILVDREIDVGELSKQIDIAQSAMSQHLRKLRDARLVDVRRSGQFVFYSCKHEIVRRVLEILAEISRGEHC
ncbi:ArsR/SmtB family transcription factor [Neorhizobium alkalisoli]|uniref:ArsR family transcriptional regulator n=1 Tax=Neorhizobium alkalisoli TaxID=528178 RepID=A0A561QAY7_9HYPH|nr:metalloregulator ArsR/SmtB family transcription factor [Neorhizobium alkalisoli]TWF47524.1 ArsR family transcriptional regulator [Neorhizobium alkalisoli]